MPLDKTVYPSLSAGLVAHVAPSRSPWREVAQALNFLSDTRIGDFLDVLEAELSASGITITASSFLEAVHPKLRPSSSPWLGLIESPIEWGEGYTYLSFKDINNYLIDVPLDSPPPRIAITKPLKYNVKTSTPVKRFIWVTDSQSLAMTTDNEVVTNLGLSHYAFDDVIYRVKLLLGGRKLFVPTVLDAEINEAWSFPHSGNPASCGLSRHLENGMLKHPELLTEVSSHVKDNLVAELVGTLPDLNVGSYMVDFLIGRPVTNIAEYMT